MFKLSFACECEYECEVGLRIEGNSRFVLQSISGHCVATLFSLKYCVESGNMQTQVLQLLN